MHDYLKYKTFKKVSFFNPYIPDMPAAGDHITVLRMLEATFVKVGEMFSGSITQFVSLGAIIGLKSDYIRQGFHELSLFGFITIKGDIFTPTDKFIKRGHFANSDKN